jgi:hypothetical protein
VMRRKKERKKKGRRKVLRERKVGKWREGY